MLDFSIKTDFSEFLIKAVFSLWSGCWPMTCKDSLVELDCLTRLVIGVRSSEILKEDVLTKFDFLIILKCCFETSLFGT